MISNTSEDLFAAFEYTFPVFEMAKLRWRALHDTDDSMHTGLNAFWHQERLATAEDRWVTTPNIDTLYSQAWVDLSQGPVQVTIPATDGRYINLAFLDIYSNNFESLSQRDVGTTGSKIVLVGPNWTGAIAVNQTIVRAPFNDVMLFARTLVDNDADMPAARAIQHGFLVEPLQAVNALDPVPRGETEGEDFVRLVRDALQRNPPPPYESDFAPLLQAAGLYESIGYTMPNQWSEILPSFLTRITESTRKINQPIDGWVYAPLNMGNFGTSYSLRAAVARGGLLALPRNEAFYTSTEFDAHDEELHGDNIYCLELPANADAPANAFWSLTLYEKMPNGARFLARNALNRHAFTDRSDAMQQSSSGPVTVWISHRRPPDGLVPYWLPAPSAPFRLSYRAYHATPELLAGTFKLKPVQKTNDFE